MEQNEEESIDLGRLAGVMARHKKKLGIIVIGFTLVALIVSFILPKKYESTTLVQTRTGQGMSSAAAAAAMLGMGGADSPTTNYMELMKSRSVLQPIIDSMEWEDEDKIPEPKDFAKKYLDIKNTKQTNLIEVTATGKTPEEAQMISQSVVENFLALQTDKNQQTQSLLLKFLDDRINTTKQEAEEAQRKFADYQREHKIYSPEQQAKVLVNQLKEYDDAISSQEVAQQTGQAKLASTQAKLNEINAGSLSYNINDNPTVASIRSQIVNKQVELVGLRQKYTEEHPSVRAAESQLADLQSSLSNEVEASVASQASSLSPAQAKLFEQEAQSEVGLAVSKASIDALTAKRDEKQKEMGDYPSSVIEYMQLQRDADIKNQIYVNLVKESENDKIKEAMESMDIQVVDEANLPREDRPSFPRKKLITAIGFVLGAMVAFGYSLVLYKRETA